MNSQDEDAWTKAATSYVRSLLAHFQQGSFVLFDYQGRTYAGVLQEIPAPKACSGLVRVQKIQQPLPQQLCEAIARYDTTIQHLRADASLPLEGRVHFDAHLQDHTLRPITQEQYVHLMSQP